MLLVCPSLGALLVFAVYVVVAFISFRKAVLWQSLISTLDRAHKVDETFNRPLFLMLCPEDTVCMLSNDTRGSYVDDGSAQGRSCQSVGVGYSESIGGKFLLLYSLQKHGVNRTVLEEGHLVLVAEDPEFGQHGECGIEQVESASVEPELEELEHLLLNVRQLDSALSSLLESAIESGAKVV